MSLLKYFQPKNDKTKKRKAEEIESDNNNQSASTEEPKKKRKIDDTILDDNKQPETPKNEKTNKNEKINEIKKNIKYENCDELLHESWKKLIKNEFQKPYFIKLKKNLKKEESSGVEIFPPINEVFAAFDYCHFDNLKAVIIGQDPYHDDGQAEGLCFSVKKGIKIPSSLRNMFKEAENDNELKNKFIKPNHGSLIEWAKQGVLLLNTVLTVRAHKANSHKNYGWQEFTNNIIKLISNKHNGCVFICWGKQAQKKIDLIDCKKHKIIKSAHPSGLSASRGFYGSKPYSKCNKLLIELGKEPIDWRINN